MFLISDFHNMDCDDYVEDDFGSSVSSYTDEVQLSRSMENGDFTCGIFFFYYLCLIDTIESVQ